MAYGDSSFSLESAGSLITVLDLDSSAFRQLTYMGHVPANDVDCK